MAEGNTLQLVDICKSFSGVQVLNKINLTLHKHEIHALVGENGAGKSTLMKVLSGYYPKGTYTGEIILDGEPVSFHNIKMAQDHGIQIISQELELVLPIPVYENVFLGNEMAKNGLVNHSAMIHECQALINKLGLDINPLEKVGNLGIGKRQLVAIAKALACKARIIIFDEPTAALTDAEALKLFDIIRKLKEEGVDCIYISHRLKEVIQISDMITVIRDGETVISDKTSNFDENLIVKYMVGREIGDRFPKRDVPIGDTALIVRNLNAIGQDGKKIVNNISLEVKSGEIVGLAGLMGAGRTELLMSIFGALNAEISGEIYVNGEKIDNKTPYNAIKNRISLVVEDRKKDGLVLCRSVKENITLASLDDFISHGLINNDKELVTIQKYVSDLRIKTSSIDLQVERLSGGNQQKVVLAKALLTKPIVLLMDEPTRGVDVGAKREIYSIMNDLAAQGVAILMASSELPEILGVSDRILVMRQGQITGELSADEATQEKIMALAT